VDALTQDGAQAFDWPAVQAAAVEESWADVGGDAGWQFVKLAFDNPNQSVSGLGVLLSGAAAYANTSDVTPSVTGNADFRRWFEPVAQSVPNFNTLGSDPVAAMASRGASVADIGLQPESRWLANLDGLTRSEPVEFAYPQYPFVFDFPLARWTTTVTEEQQAVSALQTFLLSEAQQNKLTDYGLRPASGEVGENAPIFARAVPYGVKLTPTFAASVGGLPRTETQRLLQWFNGLR
jgi:hypothetical protein